MHLYLFKKGDSLDNLKRFYTDREVELLKSSEYWFTLFDKGVIAECSAKKIDIGVQIDDVLVEKEFRGQGICQTLVKSVLNFFQMKGIRVLIKGEVNTPQETCYRKVFGEGIVEDGVRIFLK